MQKFKDFFNEKTGLSRDTLSRYKTKASDARLHKNLSVKKRDNRYASTMSSTKPFYSQNFPLIKIFDSSHDHITKGQADA